MASRNKVELIGYLGKKPEVNAGNVVKFSIATKEQWTNASGVKQEHTEWHNVTAFQKLGETCVKYLDKGSLVFASGRLHTSSYGEENNKKYRTEIILKEIQFLDRPKIKESSQEEELPQEEVSF